MLTAGFTPSGREREQSQPAVGVGDVPARLPCLAYPPLGAIPAQLKRAFIAAGHS